MSEIRLGTILKIKTYNKSIKSVKKLITLTLKIAHVTKIMLNRYLRTANVHKNAHQNIIILYL